MKPLDLAASLLRDFASGLLHVAVLDIHSAADLKKFRQFAMTLRAGVSVQRFRSPPSTASHRAHRITCATHLAISCWS